MILIGNSIDVCKLACSFKGCADVFRSFLLREELILFDEFNINEAKYAANEERQLI